MNRHKEYYWKNRTKLLQKKKEWYNKNKEKVRKYQHEYHKKYYKKNKERLIIKNNQWTEGSGYRKYYQRKESLDLLEIMGGKCIMCGETDKRLLERDHINNGKKDRERFSGGHAMIRYYLKHPKEAKKNLQPLCANCHKLKTDWNNKTIEETMIYKIKNEIVRYKNG